MTTFTDDGNYIWTTSDENTKFAPYTNETLHNTRPEAVNTIRETLGTYTDDYDIDAIAAELIAWHTCYTERNGETVEWLPGNGYYIQQFADDVEREDYQSFWELMDLHRKSSE